MMSQEGPQAGVEMCRVVLWKKSFGGLEGQANGPPCPLDSVSTKPGWHR